MSTPARYDAIVIGAGHNGLTTAAYLARAGKRVLVLERRGVAGGVAAEDVRDGFHHMPGLLLCGPLLPEVVRDLGLMERGLKLLPLEPSVVALGDGGRPLSLWRDERRSQGEIRRISQADAEAYPRFHGLMVKLAKLISPLMTRTPPELPPTAKGDQLFLMRRALALKRLGKHAMRQALRIPALSLADCLGEWFEDDLLKSTLAADALLGVFRGPRSPWTSFGLLHHHLPEVYGGAWALPGGGMASVARSFLSAAEGAGATVRLGEVVTRILTDDGRARGVELASGETIEAPVVASAADPKHTFLKLVDPVELEPRFLVKIRALKAQGSVARVSLALDGPPHLPAGADGKPAPRLRVSPSIDYLERAFDAAKYGRFPTEPLLDVVVPSLLDPGAAPAGKHLLTAHVQYTPYHLKKGAWDDWREELGEVVVDALGAAIPGLRSMIIHRQVYTPADLEAQLGVTSGHLYHGEMVPNQFFSLRPIPGWAGYRTPIDGLYLCGSGAHPGGGITGAPGYNAAREILKDWPRISAPPG